MIRCHQELKMWIASITDDHYTMEWSYMTNGDETEFISPSHYLSQRLASRSETHLVASVILSVLVLELVTTAYSTHVSQGIFTPSFISMGSVGSTKS